MKALRLAFWVALAGGVMVSAATTRVGSKGMLFTVEDWSAQEVLAAKSKAGPISLARLTCMVTQQLPDHPETSSLEVVWDPGSGEVLFGDRPQRYLVVGRKIWGVSQQGPILRVRQSEPFAVARDDILAVADRSLTKFIDVPNTDLWEDSTVRKLDLCSVFGYNTMHGGGPGLFPSSVSQGDLAEISDVDVDDGVVTVKLRATANGEGLCVTLGSNVQVLSASRAGNPVLVLRDGSISSKVLGEWSAPDNGTLAAVRGEVASVVCNRTYPAQDSSGELASAKAVVLSGTGDMWIGPSVCKLAVVRGRILGVTVEDHRDLLMFAGPRARIPLSPESIRVFEAELLQFEGAFQASGRVWKPDSSMNLAELFKGEARFEAPFEFSLRKVIAREDGVVLTFNSGSPGVHAEVVLGPDLQVVSSRAVPLD